MRERKRLVAVVSGLVVGTVLFLPLRLTAATNPQIPTGFTCLGSALPDDLGMLREVPKLIEQYKLTETDYPELKAKEKRGVEITGQEQERGYIVFSRHYLDNVYYFSLPNNRIDKLSVFASPEEYEPVTFAIYGLKDIKDFKITISDLADNSGNVIKSGNIDIRVVRSLPFIRDEKHYGLEPILLEKPKVIPVEKDKSTWVWLTLYVPKGTPPGTYQARITLSAPETKPSHLGLSLKVLPIRLEEPDVLNGMCFLIPNREYLHPENLSKYFADMKAHGMNSIWTWPDFEVKKVGEKIICDFSKFGLTRKDLQYFGHSLDTILSEYQKAGFSKLWICGSAEPLNDLLSQMGYHHFTPEFDQSYIECARQLVAHARQKGWPEFAWHPIDEPNYNREGSMEYALYYYKLLKEHFPEIKTFADIGPWTGEDEKLFPYVDLMTYACQKKENIEKCKEAGCTFWIYNHGGWGRFNKIDRLNRGIYTWKTGAKGNYDWVYTWWIEPKVPPSWHPSFVYVVPAPDGPLPTVAWEGIREGIDDLRYIYTLHQLIEKAKASKDSALMAEAAKAEEVLNDIMKDVPFEWLDREPYLERTPGVEFDLKRWKIAQQIIALEKATGDCPKEGEVFWEEEFKEAPLTRWKVWAKSMIVEGSVRGVVIEDGVLTLKEKEADLRATSLDRFLYGTAEFRVRLTGSQNADYYLGLMDREKWGYNALLLMTSRNHAFSLGTTKDGKYTGEIANTGILENNRWYTIKIVWEPERVALFLDEKLLGSTEDPARIPNAYLPVVFDLVTFLEEAGMDIDWIRVRSEKMASEVPVQTQVSLPANRHLDHPMPTLVKVKPRVIVSTNSAILENTYYQISLSWEKRFLLSQIFHKSIREDCLKEPSQRFFSVTVNGKRFDASDFVVQKAEKKRIKGGESLLLDLLLPVEKITARLKMDVTDSPELSCDLSFRNIGSEKVTFSAFFPLIENIDIGNDLRENYYYFPFESGYCGNAVFDLRCEYGGAAQMQVLDVFNREIGGGLYLYPRDSTGSFKTLILRKIEKENTIPPAYTVTLCPQNNPGAIFPFKPGVVVGINYLEDSLPAGETYHLPETIIGIHHGDWRTALENYSQWVHTWYQPVVSPRWFKDFFNYMSVHPYQGNYGFERGFYSKEEGRYIFVDQMVSDREDQVSEWSLWWDYPEDESIPAIALLRKYRMGDYYYPSKRGGLQPLKEEIKRVHERGGRVILYMEITQLWKDTDIGKAHGKEWARMDAPGVYNRDYCVEPDDGWIVCPYVEGWQDYVAHRFAQIIKETGADGVRLDRGSSMYPCFNPGHKHYQGSVKSALPAKDMASLLQKVTSAIKKANPEAVVESECFASDYLAQFIDGSLDHKHAYAIPEYGDKRTLNLYEINFWRFYFPESKLYLWGQGLWEEEGAKRGFFNGIAVERSVGPSPEESERRCRYLAQVARLFKENADAFNTHRPVPLIKTEKDFVYANKFPIPEKTLYTLWNRNDHRIEGEVLSLPVKEDRHYVELFYDQPLTVKYTRGKQTLSLSLEAQDVICIAELPQVLSLNQRGDNLEVTLKRRPDKPELIVVFGQDHPNNLRKVEIKGEKVVVPLSEISVGTKVIVKLLNDGYLVDEAVVIKK